MGGELPLLIGGSGFLDGTTSAGTVAFSAGGTFTLIYISFTVTDGNSAIGTS